MDRPQRSALAHHWTLDPTCVFLNHGSFGASPKFIIDEQRKWQDILENEPVRFFEETLHDVMLDTRKSLAKMLNCDPEDLALIENATSGVNTILRSLKFALGDEILVPDHAYQAVSYTHLTLPTKA